VPADSISAYRKKVNRIVLASRIGGVILAVILFSILAGSHIIFAILAAALCIGIFVIAPAPYIRVIKRTVERRDLSSSNRHQLGR
jgi:hypothetical protein